MGTIGCIILMTQTTQCAQSKVPIDRGIHREGPDPLRTIPWDMMRDTVEQGEEPAPSQDPKEGEE